MAELILSSEEAAIECPQIYGISTAQKAYKLAWQIRRSADFAVRKLDDISHYYLGGKHTLYELTDLDHDTRIYMVRNRGENGFFYSKFKQFNFLLFSTDPELPVDNKSITSFKALNAVSLCLALESPSNKDNMNFVQFL